MQFHILTAFPEIFGSPLNETILKKAQDKGIINVNLVPLRDFVNGKHYKLDDYPFGGGGGMVFKPGPICQAFESLNISRNDKNTRIVYLSPQGKRLDQAKLTELSELDTLVLLCGRYKGVDQRVIDLWIDEEISVGDYVLSGGELPALIIFDGVSRLLSGVLGNEGSASSDTFHSELLDYPTYTRPATWKGIAVPEVLLCGDHQKIATWRKQMSVKKTAQNRHDLYEKYLASAEGRNNE